jgi:hypothetical protein
MLKRLPGVITIVMVCAPFVTAPSHAGSWHFARYLDRLDGPVAVLGRHTPGCAGRRHRQGGLGPRAVERGRLV